MRACHHREQADLARVRGEKDERGVALEFRNFRATSLWRLPEVVGHADAVEASILGGQRDLRQRRAKAVRGNRPVEIVDVQNELHDAPPLARWGTSADARAATTRPHVSTARMVM